ncbi:MAG TPA: replication endonuclease, partial [Arsenophonus nasoniae]
RLRSLSIATVLGDMAEKVRKAADEGDFAAYIDAQGGPCTPRKEQTLRVAYKTADEPNAYDEAVQKIAGIYAQLHPDTPLMKTRLKKYRLVKKEPEHQAVDFLKSAIGAPRSSGNNCRKAIVTPSFDVHYFMPDCASREFFLLREYGFSSYTPELENPLPG